MLASDCGVQDKPKMPQERPKMVDDRPAAGPGQAQDTPRRPKTDHQELNEKTLIYAKIASHDNIFRVVPRRET